jgi:hypothetical protein
MNTLEVVQSFEQEELASFRARKLSGFLRATASLCCQVIVHEVVSSRGAHLLEFNPATTYLQLAASFEGRMKFRICSFGVLKFLCKIFPTASVKHANNFTPVF